MGTSILRDALLSVDWNANVKEFLADKDKAEELHGCSLVIAYWAKQFENIDKRNSALSFIREMQASGFNVCSLAALGQYKPASAAIRNVFESALYYTFFRTHPSELETLSRDHTFFLFKNDIVEYHKKHTPDFINLQNYFSWISKAGIWYNKISSVVHGKIPGEWVDYNSVSEIKYSHKTLCLVIESYKEGVELVNYLFLCTVAREFWQNISKTAKRIFLKGISGETKAALGMDEA